jgi:hypothetical protein
LTQFLLAAFAPALPPGFYCRTAASRPGAGDAASTLFPGATDVCEIRPEGAEMDAICDDARRRVRKGARFEDTQLADVLDMLHRAHCSFALFCGVDFLGLPLPLTIEELMRDVEQQLKAGDKDHELYIRWDGRA